MQEDICIFYLHVQSVTLFISITPLLCELYVPFCVWINASLCQSDSRALEAADQQDQWRVKYPVSLCFDLIADKVKDKLGGVEVDNVGDEGKRCAVS